METFLAQASIYLLAAVIAVPLATRAGLGSVLGYLVAGVIIGPVLGLVALSDTTDLQHFAEFGVVLMLFLIGLELEPHALWNMRHRLLGLGGMQILASTFLIMLGAMVFGLPWSVALATGMILALSSTAIVLQTLGEKNLMQTPGGRSSFSVLLAQDIAIIPMLVIIPLLTFGATIRFAEDGSIQRASDHGDHHALSLVAGLPGWGAALVTLGAIGVVILFGIFATGPIFRFVHQSKLREMFTAVALLIVIGIAFLMLLVGLSPALGTFLAGVLLANSEFRHELESDIEPFKGLLLGLFFITVGAGINFETLFREPVTILGLTLALMVVKGVVLFTLATLFKLRGPDKWLVTLGLAQAGEFGFVLTSFSLQQSVLPPLLGERLLLIVALSMLLTPLFFILYQAIAQRLAAGADPVEHDTVDEAGKIIIAGIGRFGQVVNRLVQVSGYRTVVLDSNLKTIQLMRRFGFKGFFGDPTRPELLHAAGLDTAKVLVVALDDKEAATRLVAYARRARPDIHIVARAYDRVHVYQLYRAGADDIVREMFDSSLRAGRYVLENIGLSEYEAAEQERMFYKHDRAGLRELAELWVPGLPVAENTAYIGRARELNSELETALVSALDRGRSAPEDTAAE